VPAANPGKHGHSRQQRSRSYGFHWCIGKSVIALQNWPGSRTTHHNNAEQLFRFHPGDNGHNA
jgi:hypothetical protein